MASDRVMREQADMAEGERRAGRCEWTWSTLFARRMAGGIRTTCRGLSVRSRPGPPGTCGARPSLRLRTATTSPGAVVLGVDLDGCRGQTPGTLFVRVHQEGRCVS